MIRNALLTLLLVTPLFAQTRQLDLPSTSGWVDTGVDLNAGDTVKITATGQLQYSNAKQPNGPEGLPRGFADLVRVLQLNDSGRGALIGRVGSTEADRPFLIGASSNTQARVAGRLFVTINQSSFDHATGSYHVTIDRTAAPATIKADVHVPPFPQSLINTVPRRVSDPQGSPGDRVNFITEASIEIGARQKSCRCEQRLIVVQELSAGIPGLVDVRVQRTPPPSD